VTDQRPLAVVMVADPTPLTLTNLRQLSRWCDLLLTEGTETISGQPRRPLRSGWRDLLGLTKPRLRVITTDLAGEEMWQRERIQRDSCLPVLAFEDPERFVLMLDADEFLDAELVQERLAEGLEEPARLGLVPLYGGVDRRARSIHCCWNESLAGLRDPDARTRRPYVVAAPSVATAGQMKGRSPSGVRFRSPLIDKERTFGIHVTMTGTGEQTEWKLRNMREVWDERVMMAAHLELMLSAGVHHAGWWIATYREPEPWLLQLARDCDLRVCGPMLPGEHLRALRAWAEARLDPLVPAALVAAGDAYAAGGRVDAQDFLPGLDEWLLSREVEHTGRQRQKDRAGVEHEHGDATAACPADPAG